MDVELYSKCIIDLICKAFNGEYIASLPDGIELEPLYELAKMHNIANIVYLPLSKLELDNDDVLNKFKQIYQIKLMNDAVQSTYLDLIVNKFESTGIKHCVMKGPIIKPLYPRPDFRQSGDLDIYVPVEQREEARSVMESLGFKIERYNLDDADDVYKIPGKIEVELHRTLVSNKTEWQDECQKIVDRLVLKDGKNFSYEMTKEDYYLYMIAHMGKHFKYTSVGIKMVLDIWVYLKAYNDTLDWDIINTRIEECGLLQLEQNFRKLVDYWFYNKEPDELTKKLNNYVMLSGTFGNKKQLDMYLILQVSNGSKSMFVTKYKYYFDLFFQPYEWMCKRYPVLLKIPVILPMCWVHRALKTLLFDRKKSKRIASRYNDVNINDSIKLQSFKHQVGV